MLRFAVYQNGTLAKEVNLAGAYLVGSDGVPLRADIEFKKGEIICRKRATGPAALALLWPIDRGGRMILETTRLPEREKPYILQLELLRGRLMRLAQKREDWGLHDFEGTDHIAKQIDASRDQLVEALKADTPGEAAAAAEKGIGMSLMASEQLTTFHAEIFLNRRKQVGGFSRKMFGCTADVAAVDKIYLKHLVEVCDFVSIPFSWKTIEPREKEYNWEPFDRWVEWARKNRLPVHAANLISFSEEHTPDWLYIWQHDYDSVRDMVNEHIRRLIGRYGQYVQAWNVISGLHAHNCFGFNFEQLIELTRMSVAITKQLAPRGMTIIDLVMPWGEYYATNQRTIPPMLYAEMITQSGVNLDAFGVQCYFGVPAEGMFVRDIFQISSMLDRFACLGKPVHITGVQVPSGVDSDPQDAWGGSRAVSDGGAWHKEWSEETQRAWLRRIFHIALSKPFIESITWRDLADRFRHHVPHGGLLRADGTPKPAYTELMAIRKELISDPRTTTQSPK